MIYSAFERALVAEFANREARHTGSLDCMRATCFILRNRVKAGWGDGTWLAVMEGAVQVSGHLAIESSGDLKSPHHPGAQSLNSSDRLLQLMIRDVDDIYLEQERVDDHVRQLCCGEKPPETAALYYAFNDRPIRPWFAEHIVRARPQVGVIGTMMIYL